MTKDIIIPCMRGIQCHREYFVAQMPTTQVRELLQVCDVAASRHRPSATDFSAIVQRSIDWGRVRKLVKYVLHGFGANNVRQGDFYILPGITVAFNPGAGAVIEFESLDGVEGWSLSDPGDFGVLRLPQDTQFHVIDGQHRAAAVEQALGLNDALADETLVVSLYLDMGSAFVQDAFVAINSNAKGVNSSTVLAMSQRDPNSQLAREVVSRLPWADRISVEATSVSKSEKYLLFALNGFERACRILAGKSGMDAQEIAYFWETVTGHMPLWQEAFKSQDCRDLRQNSYGLLMIALWGIAQAGADLRGMHGDNYLDALGGLENIDWSRSNPQWEEMGFTQNGILSINKYSQAALAEFVKASCMKFMESIY